MHEYLVYIHGVSQDHNRKHKETYDKLHDGVKAVDKQFPNRAKWETANRCDVEWGWNYDNHPAPEGDRLLAQAQEQFANDILPEIKDAADPTLNPFRLLLFTMRTLMIKGFSDMFYYTSRDGKNSIRATVASQILQRIHQPLEQGEPISLTLIAHSAGSVVAFDLLFYLFSPPEIYSKHEFIEDKQPITATDTMSDFKKLRQLAENKKLRVRRLITFGSPLSMLAFRSNAVVEILASGHKLNPSHYGLDRNPEVFVSPLQGARWINFWDKDDIISWPASLLMQDSPVVKDIYTDVGDHVSSVHNKYWSSSKIHELIAAHW